MSYLYCKYTIKRETYTSLFCLINHRPTAARSMLEDVFAFLVPSSFDLQRTKCNPALWSFSIDGDLIDCECIRDSFRGRAYPARPLSFIGSFAPLGSRNLRAFTRGAVFAESHAATTRAEVPVRGGCRKLATTVPAGP